LPPEIENRQSQIVNRQCPQVLQSPLEQESHDGSDMPATTLPPLSAKKSDSLRRMSFAPHFWQVKGASASVMGRMTSN
jgi:hypothetical protein